jgi:hypothetical protein
MLGISCIAAQDGLSSMKLVIVKRRLPDQESSYYPDLRQSQFVQGSFFRLPLTCRDKRLYKHRCSKDTCVLHYKKFSNSVLFPTFLKTLFN